MNKFTIHYPNGIKRHVNKSERDLLSESLLEVAPHTYFCGSDSLLKEMRRIVREREFLSGPNFLELLLIFEYLAEREYEREATPKCMIERLFKQGFQPKPAEAVA